MSSWPDVALGVSLSALGLAGTLGGAWVSRRWTLGDSQAAEQARRRERGSEVLAPVGSLLADFNPVTVGLNAGDAMGKEITRRFDGWLRDREPIVAYANSHPDPGMALAGQRLIVAVTNFLKSVSWLNTELLNRADTSERWLKVAKADHERAQALMTTMLSAVRGEVRPDLLAPRVEAIDKAANEKHESL